MPRLIDLPRYIPPHLKEYAELMAIYAAEHPEFIFAWEQIDKTRWNQFILTADEDGIKAFEDLLSITAKKGEDLEFRRQRLLLRLGRKSPYTMEYLEAQLDLIIGANKYKAWVSQGQFNYLLGDWKLGEKPFAYEPFVLHIETAVEDQYWFEEVEVLINEIKPANIVYRYIPMVNGFFSITEEIQRGIYNWNYKLGSWGLGQESFLTDEVGDIIKARSTKSIDKTSFDEYAKFTSELINKVLLNNTFEATNLSVSTEENKTIIEYIVPKEVGDITDIKLFKRDGSLFSHAKIFIPQSAEQIKPRHTIYHEEVV